MSQSFSSEASAEMPPHTASSQQATPQASQQTSQQASQGTSRQSTLSALSAALGSELKLVEELTGVIVRQRTAIANNDIDAIDDTVFITHRLLLTLEQARMRRRTLYRLLGYDETVRFRDLADMLGPSLTPDIEAERDLLEMAADNLSREIIINREILQTAITHGDTCIRALTGMPTQTQFPIYGIDGIGAQTPPDASFTRMG